MKIAGENELKVAYRPIAQEIGSLDITGGLDEDSAEQVRIQAAAAIRGGTVNLALNFSGVSFVDSAGLRAVIFVKAMMSRAGGALFVVGLPQPILTVFSVTGLTSVLPIYANERDLLSKLGHDPARVLT